MSTYFFKTDIDDTGTAVHIKPHLDRLEQSKEIAHWRVHVQDPQHVLEIESGKMSLEEIRNYLEEKGIRAEPMPVKKAPRVTNASERKR